MVASAFLETFEEARRNSKVHGLSEILAPSHWFVATNLLEVDGPDRHNPFSDAFTQLCIHVWALGLIVLVVFIQITFFLLLSGFLKAFRSL